MNWGEFTAILPEIALAVFGMALLIADAWSGEDRRLAGGLALAGILVSGLLLWPAAGLGGGEPLLGGMVLADGFALFFRILLLAAAFFVALSALAYVERNEMPAGDFYALLLFATTGALFMVSAGDLISFYVGFELLSISSYVMAGLLRREAASMEASLKYFLNGAMASAILLFGLSLLYGVTGTTALAGIAEALAAGPLSAVLLAGLILVVAGLGFKVAAVPFHLWTPDTYQGAPTPVTLFLSIGSKGATFAVILRIFLGSLGDAAAAWQLAFAILAVLSMTVGNVVALQQRNLKRLLAYSSIAQAGYILSGVAAGTQAGLEAVLFYSFAYVFMNAGAFGAVMAVSRGLRGEELEDWAGLGRRRPLVGFTMVVFMLSLLGIPPTAGFFGKLFLFRATVEAGLSWLAVAIAVNAAISIGYYYGVLRVIYLPEPSERPLEEPGWAARLGLVLAAAGVLLLGIFPDSVIRWVSAASFLP